MRQGGQHHAREDYRAALGVRLDAFAIAGNPIDSGRAARDISASFDRIGNTMFDSTDYRHPVDNSVRANAYAEYAYRAHDVSVLHSSDISSGRDIASDGLIIAREFTVSAMYLAISQARANEYRKAIGVISEADRFSIALFRRFKQFHQYDVNLSPRVAALGSSMASIHPVLQSRARLAMELAALSETDAVLGFNPMLSDEQVAQAQRKAKIRAVAARAVVEAGIYPTRWITQPFVRGLIDKVIL